MNDFKWEVANRLEFQGRLKALADQVSDLRIPFRLIASDFYRSQKKLFTLKGPGRYPPLGGFNSTEVLASGKTRRQVAEERKTKKVGFAYPLLVGATRDLSASTLSPSHKYSHFFLGRGSMEIGTTVPYGKFHQSDERRTTLPQRKFLFIDGGPGDQAQDSSISGRRERWINIVDDHLTQIVTGRVL